MTLREWQRTFKNINELIVQASTTDGEDRWQLWPIGMSWQFPLNAHKGPILQIGNHTNTVYCGITDHTDINRRGDQSVNRKKILENLSKNGIYNTIVDHTVYFDLLPNFKFVISPEGSGIDCHRHYEALMAGCIPIIEKNPLSEIKFKDLPILWTTDYSEITFEYLEGQYNQMLDKIYNFSPLFISYYPEDIQQEIKSCGNHWCRKIVHVGRNWY